jgi:hypothetical protein
LRAGAEGPALHLLASQTNAGMELRVGEGGSDISLLDANGTRRTAQTSMNWSESTQPFDPPAAAPLAGHVAV